MSMFKLKKLTYIFIFYIFSLIALAEAFMRWDGRWSYYEGLTNYIKKNEPYVHSPNQELYYEDRHKEFWYKLSCNSLGLRDIEHPIKKEKNEFRILCLGDSFTEGYGVDFEDSWPRQLSRIFEEKGVSTKISVMMGGRYLCDPFLCFDRLNRLLLPYQPDLVLLPINGTDFSDAMRYGGLERFGSVYAPVSKEAHKLQLVGDTVIRGLFFGAFDTRKYIFPVWSLRRLILDACCRWSHLARGVCFGLFGFSTDFYSPSEKYRFELELFSKFQGLLEKFKELGKENAFQFVPVLFPLLTDHRDVQWPYYLERGFSDNHQLNLFPFFENMSLVEKQSHYWPLDTHFNEKGYRVFAEQVAQFLIKSQLVPVETD